MKGPRAPHWCNCGTKDDRIMKRPKYLTALVLGGFSIWASLTAIRGEEPGSKPAEVATLDQLARIPASRFTKVIENSTSPDKRLAVALGSKDGKKPDWEGESYEGRGGAVVHSYILEDCRNYVIDLRADRVTGILDGTHFGTRIRHNHESHSTVWSPDSRWLVETQSWKWHTETCTVHRLDAGGGQVARLDFVKEAGEIVDAWLQEQFPKVTADQRGRYAVTISVERIGDDGRLIVGISAQIPKDTEAEYVNVFATAKVEQAEDGKLTLGDSKVVGRE